MYKVAPTFFDLRPGEDYVSFQQMGPRTEKEVLLYLSTILQGPKHAYRIDVGAILDCNGKVYDVGETHNPYHCGLVGSSKPPMMNSHKMASIGIVVSIPISD